MQDTCLKISFLCSNVRFAGVRSVGLTSVCRHVFMVKNIILTGFGNVFGIDIVFWGVVDSFGKSPIVGKRG